MLPTQVVFLEASEDALIRRFSETRRPHPMGRTETVLKSIRAERKRLEPIRNVADIVLDTTKFNVHDLRAHINAQFEREESDRNLTISSNSFGFKNGVPTEADLVFDVRFLPNPHFVPEFRKLTGRHPKVAKYVRQFPQTTAEFLDKTMDMLKFLLAALHQGRQELPDSGVWMHWWPTSFGLHRRGDEEAPDGGGLSREDSAPRYAEV